MVGSTMRKLLLFLLVCCLLISSNSFATDVVAGNQDGVSWKIQELAPPQALKLMKSREYLKFWNDTKGAVAETAVMTFIVITTLVALAASKCGRSKKSNSYSSSDFSCGPRYSTCDPCHDPYLYHPWYRPWSWHWWYCDSYCCGCRHHCREVTQDQLQTIQPSVVEDISLGNVDQKVIIVEAAVSNNTDRPIYLPTSCFVRKYSGHVLSPEKVLSLYPSIPGKVALEICFAVNAGLFGMMGVSTTWFTSNYLFVAGGISFFPILGSIFCLGLTGLTGYMGLSCFRNAGKADKINAGYDKFKSSCVTTIKDRNGVIVGIPEVIDDFYKLYQGQTLKSLFFVERASWLKGKFERDELTRISGASCLEKLPEVMWMLDGSAEIAAQ
jgi:hypothetical protein